MDQPTPVYDVELRLGEDENGMTLAREFTRTTLARWMYKGDHHNAVLVVSELVTNALIHGHGAPVLRLIGAGKLRVEVSDDSPVLPAIRDSGATGGWGLKLVEQLAPGWGASRSGRGKVVWCELAPALAPVTAVAQATVA
jgi:anti-sigma regulatory factor (Ser/Thr protein kinase)